MSKRFLEEALQFSYFKSKETTSMKPSTLIFILNVLAVATSYAGVLFSDDFSSYSIGSLTTGSSPNLWASASKTAPNITEVVSDSSNWFQQGTSNKALHLVYSGTAGSQSIAANNFATGTTTGQVSFNFYDATDTDENGAFTFRIGTATGNASTAFAVGIGGGTLYYGSGSSVGIISNAFGTYVQGQLNSLSIVFNNSSTTLSYDGGTVAAKKMDVWLNGILVGNEVSNTGTNVSVDVLLYNLNITTKVLNSTVDFNNSAYFDNIIFSDVISIPEAGGMAYICGGLFALLGILFKRHKLALLD